jgi:tetrapyrrole methylase family protein/MazG family protein
MKLQDSLPARVSDNSIVLRYEVQESDLATVRDIVESTGFFYPAEVDVAVELVEERLRRGDASGYFFAFAEVDGRTVGYSCYGPIACTTSSFDIFWIAVHSDAQRHGMGKWLMSVTEKLIFDRGGERIYVETSGRDHYLPTRKFYDRCGYQQAAELPEFYGEGDSKVIYLKTRLVAASAETATLADTMPQPGTPPEFDALLPEFQRLCEVVARLRAPDGCPWDRQQTMKTIKPYTLEETYELLEAIDSDDNIAICEELGDVLLQVILDSQIAADEQRFLLTDVVQQIADKMIRRHPHVFGNADAQTTDDVKRHWHAIKRQEKPARESQLEGIPLALPELTRAARITARAAAVGYDFPDRRMLFDKLNEELQELAVELFGSSTIPTVLATVDADVLPDEPMEEALKDKAESELGDVLFVLANIGRRWGINPEEALRRSNAKFSRRFQAIEEAMKRNGRSMHDATLREMEDAYQAAKRREPGTTNNGMVGS